MREFKKYWVGSLSAKKLILSILMDLNFNYKEVLLEARGNKIPKLLVILEILRRLTHDSLEIELKYSYIEDDNIKNKNGLFFDKLLIPVVEARLRKKQ
jgi:DNA-binding protein